MLSSTNIYIYICASKLPGSWFGFEVCLRHVLLDHRHYLYACVYMYMYRRLSICVCMYIQTCTSVCALSSLSLLSFSLRYLLSQASLSSLSGFCLFYLSLSMHLGVPLLARVHERRHACVCVCVCVCVCGVWCVWGGAGGGGGSWV